MPTWKPKTFKMTVETYEDAEEILLGVIVAKSNNSNEFFVDLLDALNTVMEPHRAALQGEQLDARAKAGMP